MLFSLIIEGFAVGSIYALVAVGFLILFLSSGCINLAHGDLMMFSTFIAYMLLVQMKLPLIVAVLGTLMFASIIGVLMEKFIIRPIIDKSQNAVIIATFGMAFVFQGIAGTVWSNNVFHFPLIFKGSPIKFGDVVVTQQNLGIIISSIAIISLIFLFLNRTKIGTGLRAVTQNREAASLMGVKLKRMYAISWILAGIMAAVAGILLAPTLFLSTGMGSIVFIAIVATIVGGFGNIFGAIIGGYILGILQTVLPLYIPSELQGLIPFVLLMLVLFIKPTGLLGGSTKKKV